LYSYDEAKGTAYPRLCIDTTKVKMMINYAALQVHVERVSQRLGFCFTVWLVDCACRRIFISRFNIVLILGRSQKAASS
jgi:hypothetical protein